MTYLFDRARTALADRYQIERQLGEGGAAIVFLAEDPKHRRRLAVKVLRPEVAGALGCVGILRITTGPRSDASRESVRWNAPAPPAHLFDSLAA